MTINWRDIRLEPVGLALPDGDHGSLLADLERRLNKEIQAAFGIPAERLTSILDIPVQQAPAKRSPWRGWIIGCVHS